MKTERQIRDEIQSMLRAISEVADRFARDDNAEDMQQLEALRARLDGLRWVLK